MGKIRSMIRVCTLLAPFAGILILTAPVAAERAGADDLLATARACATEIKDPSDHCLVMSEAAAALKAVGKLDDASDAATDAVDTLKGSYPREPQRGLIIECLSEVNPNLGMKVAAIPKPKNILTRAAEIAAYVPGAGAIAGAAGQLGAAIDDPSTLISLCASYIPVPPGVAQTIYKIKDIVQRCEAIANLTGQSNSWKDAKAMLDTIDLPEYKVRAISRYYDRRIPGRLIDRKVERREDVHNAIITGNKAADRIEDPRMRAVSRIRMSSAMRGWGVEAGENVREAIIHGHDPVVFGLLALPVPAENGLDPAAADVDAALKRAEKTFDVADAWRHLGSVLKPDLLRRFAATLDLSFPGAGGGAGAASLKDNGELRDALALQVTACTMQDAAKVDSAIDKTATDPKHPGERDALIAAVCIARCAIGDAPAQAASAVAAAIASPTLKGLTLMHMARVSAETPADAPADPPADPAAGAPAPAPVPVPAPAP